MERAEKTYKGHIALSVAYIIFGLNIPVSKMVLDSGLVSPFAMSLFRTAGGAVLFWIASVFLPREKVNMRDMFLLLLAGIFGIVLNQQLFLIGLQYTSPVDSSIVTTLTPAITMIISAVYLKEPITWKKVLGVMIGAAGVLTLILSSGVGPQFAGNLKGNLLVLGCSLSYATYLVVFKPLIMRYSAVTLMKWMFLFSALITLPLNLPDALAVDYAALPPSVAWGCVYTVVLATFVTYFLVPIGQQNLRPTLVGMYNYVQPIMAYIVAVIAGMDKFGWEKTLSALMVFFGVWLVNMSKSRAQVEAEQEAESPAPDKP